MKSLPFILSFLLLLVNGNQVFAQFAKGNLDWGLSGFFHPQNGSYTVNGQTVYNGRKVDLLLDGDISFMIGEQYSVGIYGYIDHYYSEIYNYYFNNLGSYESSIDRFSTQAIGLAFNYYYPISNRFSISLNAIGALGINTIYQNSQDETTGVVLDSDYPQRDVVMLRIGGSFVYYPNEKVGLFLGIHQQTRVDSYEPLQGQPVVVSETFRGLKFSIGVRMYFSIKELLSPDIKADGWKLK